MSLNVKARRHCTLGPGATNAEVNSESIAFEMAPTHHKR